MRAVGSGSHHLGILPIQQLGETPCYTLLMDRMSKPRWTSLLPIPHSLLPYLDFGYARRCSTNAIGLGWRVRCG